MLRCTKAHDRTEKSQKSTGELNQMTPPYLLAIRFGLRAAVCVGWYSPQKTNFSPEKTSTPDVGDFAVI